MIRPQEIQQKASEAGVRDQQIEKDYVLSWILKGIARHGTLAKVFVFKGGTVLQKFYFGLAGTFVQNVTLWQQTLAEKPENLTGEAIIISAIATSKRKFRP